MKTFKEWFKLREELWHTQGHKRVPAKGFYNAPPPEGGVAGAVPSAAGGMGMPKMSKRMKKKMKPS